VQLDYFNWERKKTNKGGWDDFISKKNLTDMVTSFRAKYEITGSQQADRLSAAKKCADVFGVKY